MTSYLSSFKVRKFECFFHLIECVTRICLVSSSILNLFDRSWNNSVEFYANHIVSSERWWGRSVTEPYTIFVAFDGSVLIIFFPVLLICTPTLKWISNFLCKSSIRVKWLEYFIDFILTSGVPQRSNLTRLQFVIYLFDLDSWVEYSMLSKLQSPGEDNCGERGVESP